MAQRPRKRTAAKIATKREQGEVVALAKRLAADPSPLVPANEGRRPRRIDKLERRLHRIARNAEKPRRLRWALRFGPPLTKAFANLLLVGHAGKAERMASMPTPVGSLKYAVRGNISRRHLVAVQHFRHPEVRILGYRDVAQHTGGVIWATEEGTAYTDAGRPPPQEWFDLVLPKLPITFARIEDTVRCPHFVGVTDPHDPRSPAGLSLRLAAGPTTFLVCRACIDDQLHEKGLLARLGTYVIGLRATKDIHAEVTGTPRQCVHDGTCSWVKHPPRLRPQVQERYLQGGLAESALLEKLEPAWEDAVRAADERLLVAGDYCHGTDVEDLLDALGSQGTQRDALRRFIGAGPHVLIANERSINKVLEACWDAAPRVLAEIHPDPDALERLLERHRRSQPAIVLDDVLGAREAAEAMRGYPRYTDLPEPASIAERLARAHRVGGGPRLTEEVDRELKRETHKGLIWAALRHAGSTQGREWQFPRNDQEAGEFLEGPLRELLEAEPAQYHDALAQVHTLAGGAGTIPQPKGKHG